MSGNEKKQYDRLKLREDNFNVNNLGAVRLAEYNALLDTNMRHYFENRKVQSLLYKTGQIDKHGRVIDLNKVKPRLNILEKEFKEAEAIEERLQKEELDMRHRIQRKRFTELERIRKSEILTKLKVERELSKEIVSTVRMATAGPPVSASGLSTRSKSSSHGKAEFATF